MKRLTSVFQLFLFVLACEASPPLERAAPPGKSSADEKLTLAAATQAALANNPSLREARAKWEAMKARVPQAATWDDLKITTNTTLGRFVHVGPNSFTDHMLTVEQMIPV